MNETLDDTFPSLAKARERFLRRQPSPNKIIQEDNPLIRINKEILVDMINAYYRQSRIINEECLSIYKEAQSVLNKQPSYHRIIPSNPSFKSIDTLKETHINRNQYDEESVNISISPLYKPQPTKYNVISQHTLTELPLSLPPPFQPIKQQQQQQQHSLSFFEQPFQPSQLQSLSLSPPPPSPPQQQQSFQQPIKQQIAEEKSLSELFNNKPLQLKNISFQPDNIHSDNIIFEENNNKSSSLSLLSPLSTDVTLTSVKSTKGIKLKSPTKPSIELKLIGLSKTIKNKIDMDIKHNNINTKYLNKTNKLIINKHSFVKHKFSNSSFYLSEEEVKEYGKYHKACIYYNWKLKHKYFIMLWKHCCSLIYLTLIDEVLKSNYNKPF